jgi:hypothetical protein
LKKYHDYPRGFPPASKNKRNNNSNNNNNGALNKQRSGELNNKQWIFY